MEETVLDKETKNGESQASEVSVGSVVNNIINQEIIRKQKQASLNLESLPREELIEKIYSLQKHVDQLRNVIAKNAKSNLPQVQNEKKKRNFDFTKFKRRHVLLRVAYFGWDYVGFAVQEDTGKTIESELFAALLRTKLIESRQSSNYHRCGRTDKGVSAFSQVISIDVRTNLLDGVGVFAPEGYVERENGAAAAKEELEYCTVLNRNLPDDIKVIAWSPCPNLEFSARFDCKQRTYRYFFPRANMDLCRMEEAGKLMLGSHDFRNFCKMDVNNGVTNYGRRIEEIYVICDRQEGSKEGPYDICQLVIKSNAFLWHQIRCIVSVLFLVGQGLEEPSVVPKLLDVDSMPQRPQYSISSEIPLNLFDCQYPGVEWKYDKTSVEFVLKNFQTLWTKNAVKTAMVRASLQQLEEDSGIQVISQVDCLAPRRKEQNYTPLMSLPVCNSLEDKIKTVAKRRKIELPNSS